MKGVVHGKEKRDSWWVDLTIQCLGCDGVVKLQAGDQMYITSHQLGIMFQCPYCHGTVTVPTGLVVVKK